MIQRILCLQNYKSKVSLEIRVCAKSVKYLVIALLQKDHFAYIIRKLNQSLLGITHLITLHLRAKW